MLRALVAVALVAADPLVTEEVSDVTVSNGTNSSTFSCSGVWQCNLVEVKEPVDDAMDYHCSAEEGFGWLFCFYIIFVAYLVFFPVYVICQGVVAVSIVRRHRAMKAAGEMPTFGPASRSHAYCGGVFLCVMAMTFTAMVVEMITTGEMPPVGVIVFKSVLFAVSFAPLLALCFPVDGDLRVLQKQPEYLHPQQRPRGAPAGPPVRPQPPVVAQQHPRAAPVGPPAYVQPVARHPVILGQLPHGPQRKPAGLAGSDPRAAALAAMHARV